MKKGNIFFSLFAAFVFIMSGCSEGNGVEQQGWNVSDLSVSEKINKFVVDMVEEVYLWEAETNWSRYNDRKALAKYTNHEALFKELLYKDDHWSMLTDDIAGLGNEFAGISTTFGYWPNFYKLSSGDIIAVILYSTPGSPAEKAGIKRGDVIVEINGGKMTEKNYLDLYYASSVVVRCGVMDTDTKTFEPLPETKSITAVNMYEDPVLANRIIEKEGHKIGYLCYIGYQMDSEKDLVRIFTDFKSEGVTDVVLDLRYNPGGYSRTALLLSSILAPESVVKNKGVFLEQKYNRLITNYFDSQNYDMKEYFVDTLTVNMNLDRLYVLTSANTASASEATMVGLEPYLDLIRIGGKTSGKYCGGSLFSPEDMYGVSNKDYYRNFSNWGMYIMMFRFCSIKGVSSFTGGLEPDIPAKEDYFDLKQFGDEDDPLLGRALARILNKAYVEKRSVKVSMSATPLPEIKRPFDGLMIFSPSSLPLFSSPRLIPE